MISSSRAIHWACFTNQHYERLRSDKMNEMGEVIKDTPFFLEIPKLQAIAFPYFKGEVR